MYQLDCLCSGKYISELKKTVLARSIEHQEDKMSEKLESSGAPEHIKGQFDWLDSKGVHISLNMYERKTCKMLEINKLTTINERDKTFIVLNRDNGCELLQDKFLEISFHENRKP